MCKVSDNYIKIPEMKDGMIYRVIGRNYSVAMWNEESKRFYGIREKWGDEYISGELHWDADPNYGTVRPMKEIEIFDRFILRDADSEKRLFDKIKEIERTLPKES